MKRILFSIALFLIICLVCIVEGMASIPGTIVSEINGNVLYAILIPVTVLALFGLVIINNQPTKQVK